MTIWCVSGVHFYLGYIKGHTTIVFLRFLICAGIGYFPFLV